MVALIKPLYPIPFSLFLIFLALFLIIVISYYNTSNGNRPGNSTQRSFPGWPINPRKPSKPKPSKPKPGKPKHGKFRSPEKPFVLKPQINVFITPRDVLRQWFEYTRDSRLLRKFEDGNFFFYDLRNAKGEIIITPSGKPLSTPCTNGTIKGLTGRSLPVLEPLSSEEMFFASKRFLQKNSSVELAKVMESISRNTAPTIGHNTAKAKSMTGMAAYNNYFYGAFFFTFTVVPILLVLIKGF
jgi:hypothetical protein